MTDDDRNLGWFNQRYGVDLQKVKNIDELNDLLDNAKTKEEVNLQKKFFKTTKGRDNFIRGFKQAMDSLGDFVEPDVVRANLEYLNEVKESIEQAEDVTSIQSVNIDDKYNKNVVLQLRLLKGSKEARFIRNESLREEGLNLTAEDLRRGGIRSVGRLENQYKLSPSEAQEVLSRLEEE